MGAHAYIEAEDLGLTVLGTTQYSYTVAGIHRQDYDTAVYRAALCRSVAIEEALASFELLVRTRQQKLDDLGSALSHIGWTLSTRDKDTKSDTKMGLNADAAATLRRYGFSNANSSITMSDLMKLQQDVEYAIDQEDNEIQRDMTQLENFVSKRDDAMQMSAKFMKRIAQTRQKGIRHIGS